MDITDRKRWERAEAAQSFLGALVESAEDAIISKTLDWHRHQLESSGGKAIWFTAPTK
jgi:hypothetical protein